MGLSLAQIRRLRPELRLDGDPSTVIETVTVDSRLCGPGALFVAIRGTSQDGHRYLPQAVAAGCAAILVDADAGEHAREAVAASPGAVAVLSTAGGTRALAAPLARECLGRPDARMRVVGVTGTNGKTTVAYLLRGMLGKLTGPCGLLGTVVYDTGRRIEPAPLTTPDGPTLYRLLGEMREGGCHAAALEISSHALSQGRAAHLALDAAVLTNLGRDHLDYHGDRDAYLAAKLRILELLDETERRGKAPGAVVYNAADPAFAGIERGRTRAIGFTAGPAPDDRDAARADVRVISADLALAGTTLRLAVPGGEVELDSPLVGCFNVENLAAALAAGLALGLPPDRCATALGAVRQVPGRLERFVLPNGALAVVDYAHTPDALAAVLATCRELDPRRLLLVFGCGGDRDRGKRPLMGEVAARRADRTWVTADNPRSEDPARICAEIEAGFRATGVGEAVTILDRTEAIVSALAEARPGDMVVVAGKGHEDYQETGGRRIHLDDREIIRNWLGRRPADA